MQRRSSPSHKSSDHLKRLRAALGATAEIRPQQDAMADAIAENIDTGGILIVQAGTGTGKSFAYLAPIIASGRKAIIATATIALQNQLAQKDIPVMEKIFSGKKFAVLKGRSNYLCKAKLNSQPTDEEAGVLEPFVDPKSSGMKKSHIDKLMEWASRTDTGDHDELDHLDASIWNSFSTGSDECPGARSCTFASSCFAEKARRNADTADVVVTNLHLYGLHIRSQGRILPDHDIAVLDEAHEVPEIFTSTFGTRLSTSQLNRLVRTVDNLTAKDRDDGALDAYMDSLRNALKDIYYQDDKSSSPRSTASLEGGIEASSELNRALSGIKHAMTEAVEALKRLKQKDKQRDRIERIQSRCESTIEAITELARANREMHSIILIEPVQYGHDRSRDDFTLSVVYYDVGERLSEWLWPTMAERLQRPLRPSGTPSLSDRGGESGSGDTSDYSHRDVEGLSREIEDPVINLDDNDNMQSSGRCIDSIAYGSTAYEEGGAEYPDEEFEDYTDEDIEKVPRSVIFTSATIPPSFDSRLSIPKHEFLDVGTPFDYSSQVALYVPPAPFPIPKANSPGAHEAFLKACEAEMLELISAAGGRTLALFTSYASMRHAVTTLREAITSDIEILSQEDPLSRNALLERFLTDERSCLLATRSYFQGVDVPGSSLSLVILDKLPFPSPVDPVYSARRNRAAELKQNGFLVVDIPATATLLAQAAGRLIRHKDDSGVVAVLDRRLADSKYSSVLLSSLPFPAECLLRKRDAAIDRLREIDAVNNLVATGPK